MHTSFVAATAIFILSYALIISDRVHKAAVALAGASFMVILGILDQREAFRSEEFGIDWNVILLLISMMVMVNLMKPTGIFEYIAIKGAKIGRGEPVSILAIFAVVTAVLSALLDNITTVLLICPVTMLIADVLEVDPFPYLISCVIASNIGGAATLIGDPPNIMIASKTGLGFMDFIYNLTPVIVVIMAVYILAIKLMWGKRLRTKDELKKKIMEMREKDAVKDPAMLKKSLCVITAVMAGFVFHGTLGIQPATIALFGAGLLLLLSKDEDIHRAFSEVEWPTIFFFMGLFIIVGGIAKVGLIKMVSTRVIDLTHGNMFATSMIVMWFSAFASSIVDNIPYVATINPLIIDMAKQIWPDKTGGQLLQHPDLMPVWWSLALGACLGGNGTIIGASANVVIAGMSERSGRKISFMRFMAYGMPVMILTVLISTLYVWLRYYVFKF